MKSYDEVKNIIVNAKKLKTHTEKYSEAIKPSSIDKFQCGFNKDGRFSNFSVKLSLDAYTGSYGSSSCYTFKSIDNNLAQEAMDDYANKHKDEILQWMGDYLLAKAKRLSSDAKAELEKAMGEMDECLKEVE